MKRPVAIEDDCDLRLDEGPLGVLRTVASVTLLFQAFTELRTQAIRGQHTQSLPCPFCVASIVELRSSHELAPVVAWV